MPCFKGLAVSIHTPEGPLPEYSIQRQSRVSRIACYIPVPPPKLPESGTGKPEQSTFAISITLLNPGQDVPYSTPKPAPDNLSPKPKKVGGLPGQSRDRGQYTRAVAPYQPLTTSPNETVAAYIYFDGRQKEEVATLLRKGEETWVNSRWVSVPESEGGGLAEREFLFREVGLERWLNGLDLEGKDVAARIERRRQKMEKRRSKGDCAGNGDAEAGMEKSDKSGKEIMRYGNDAKSPLEDVSDAEMSASDSDDDDPIPESAGQIKVALVRVLASGEIKRGEYSPQFDAHDDDDESPNGRDDKEGMDADIDHTTSFAKPKTLDPKSISTQTVTGIDPTDKPYAVFTFMYRGERQLQKMGILKDAKCQETLGSTKRRSLQPDFSSLSPLKPGGTVGFLNFRDGGDNKRKTRKTDKADDEDMDSDDEDDDSILGKADDAEAKDADVNLSPEDIRSQGELAEGVRKIKLKRQHSGDLFTASTGGSENSPASGVTPPASTGISTTPPDVSSDLAAALETAKATANSFNGVFVGSPLKKQRASISSAGDPSFQQRIDSGLARNVAKNLSNMGGMRESEPDNGSTSLFGESLEPRIANSRTEDEDEEL